MKLPSCSLLKLLCVALPLRTAYSLGLTDTADCKVHPDPHMSTWHGVRYDYQHGCDIILVDAAAIKIQLRLEKFSPINPTFSGIERLAIDFPTRGERLEINNNGQHFTTLSTLSAPNPTITSIGGFPFSKTLFNQWTTYLIDLTPFTTGHYIEIKNRGTGEGAEAYLSIFIRGHGTMFYDAVGMCGKWSSPFVALHDRNNFDMLPGLPSVNSCMPFTIEGATFGDNWQVQNTPLVHLEINFISNMGLPLAAGTHASHPASCVMRRRLLREEQPELATCTSCPFCMSLQNLAARANCAYDTEIMGCSFVQTVPFYDTDTKWYSKDENCCFKRQPTRGPNHIGYQFSETSIDDPEGFQYTPCDNDPSDGGCYQKKECKERAGCTKLIDCRGNPSICFLEVDCFDKCIRKMETDEGIKTVPTTSLGFYYKKCPYNDQCWKKINCREGDSNCQRYVNCSKDEDGCFEEVTCPTPCSPISAPTSAPTSASTFSPTSTPTSASTSSPTSPIELWKCDGCEWMDKHSKYEVGADMCDINVKLKVKAKDGKCEEEDGKDCKESPCNYSWQINWKIGAQCARKKCKLIVSDAYTAGSPSTGTAVSYLIKRKKGKEKESSINVECLCDTHTKLFVFQCIIDGKTFSKSIELDYTCTKCDKKLLPELKEEL